MAALTSAAILGAASLTSPSALASNHEFVPLAPIPGVSTDTGDPAGFFNAIFRIGVGAAALLAVLMITIGGFQYMTTDIPGIKTEGKNKMWGAIGGLILILLSGLLLAIINPDILSFRLFSA